MVNRRILGCVALLLFGLVQTPRVSVAQQSGAQQPSGASLPIASRIATVDGLKLHLPDGGPWSRRRPVARIRRDVPHVAPFDANARHAFHGHRARPAGHW